MPALLLAFVSGITWGAADFVGGFMTKRLKIATVLVVGQAAGLLFVIVLIVVTGTSRPAAEYVIYGALGGLAGAVGLAALYMGLAVGPMGIVAPTAALSGAVPVIVGLAQGDRPAPVQYLGMALAGVGVVLASRPDGSDTRGPMARGVALALVAALFLGLLVTSLDAAGEGDALWAALMVRVVSVPIFLLAWLLPGEREIPTARQAAVLASVGLLDNTANILFAFASRTGPLALVAVLGSLYPVSTVLLARAFLHERLIRNQAIGVAAALTGVALIATG